MAQKLLGDLGELHLELMADLAAMEALTTDAGPDRATFSDTRWRVIEGGLKRRSVMVRAFDYLMPRVEGSEAADLGTLMCADLELLRLSAGHVGTWTTEAIRANWASFCMESRVIRWRLNSYLGMEQRILFPILERAVDRGL